VQYPSEE